MMKRIPELIDGKISISKDDCRILAELLSQYENILSAIPLNKELKMHKQKTEWYRHAFFSVANHEVTI